jgi:hypothetical protein
MFILVKICPVASSKIGENVNVAPGMPVALSCGGELLKA